MAFAVDTAPIVATAPPRPANAAPEDSDAAPFEQELSKAQAAPSQAIEEDDTDDAAPEPVVDAAASEPEGAPTAPALFLIQIAAQAPAPESTSSTDAAALDVTAPPAPQGQATGAEPPQTAAPQAPEPRIAAPEAAPADKGSDAIPHASQDKQVGAQSGADTAPAPAQSAAALPAPDLAAASASGAGAPPAKPAPDDLQPDGAAPVATQTSMAASAAPRTPLTPKRVETKSDANVEKQVDAPSATPPKTVDLGEQSARKAEPPAPINGRALDSTPPAPAPKIDAPASLANHAAPAPTPAADVHAASATVEHAASRAAPAAHQVAREIVRRFNGDNTRFELRLDPPELGRVDVKLEMTRDHRVSVVVAADTPQALTELARHARDLEQALQSAGLELGDQGLSFDLRQGRAEDDAASDDASFAGAAETAPAEDAPRARPLFLDRWRGVRVDVMA